MRAILARQRLVRCAAAAASIVLLAACGAKADGQGDPTVPGRTYSAGMLAISDGTVFLEGIDEEEASAAGWRQPRPPVWSMYGPPKADVRLSTSTR